MRRVAILGVGVPALTLVLVLVLAACGSVEPEAEFVTFRGIVTTGTRVAGGGYVTVDEVRSGEALAAELDEDGTFALDIADDWISACASGTSFTDPATGLRLPWRFGHVWCAMKEGARADPRIQITPYTQLVYQYAESLSPDGDMKDLFRAWERSRQLHQAFFGCARPGVDLTAVAPLDITAAQAPRNLSDGVYLGFVIAGFSEMARLANQHMGQEDASRVTLQDVVDGFGVDGSDGIYDGRVGTRTVTLGSRLSYDGLRSGSVGFLTALRRVLDSASNQTGLRSEDLYDWFQCFADYDGPLVAGRGVLDRAEPTITLQNPADGVLVVSRSVPSIRALCDDVESPIRRFAVEAPDIVALSVADEDGLKEGLSLGKFDSALLREDDGDASLRLVCVDDAGFEARAVVVVEVDNTGPEIDSDLRSGSWVGREIVELGGPVWDVHGVQSVLVNGVAAVTQNSLWSLDMPLEATPADLRIVARDTLGNPSEHHVRLWMDLEQPQPRVVRPHGGVVGKQFTLELAATDNVQVADLRVTEPAFLAGLPDADPDPARLLLLDVDTTGFPDRFVARARAVDHVGHEGDLPIPIEVDRVPPVLSVLSHADGQWLAESTVTLRGTTEGGAARVEVNGVPAEGVAGWAAEVALVEGDNAITIEACDAVENCVDDVLTLRVDSTRPEVLDFGVVGNRDTTLKGIVALDVHARDTNGLHASLESFVFHEVPPSSLSNLRLVQQNATDIVVRISVNTGDLVDGWNEPSVIAFDKVGNDSRPRIASFYVDNNPPEVTIRVVVPRSGPISITWRATDGASDLASARLIRNGEVISQWHSLRGRNAADIATTTGLRCVGDDVYRIEVEDAVGHVGQATWSRPCELTEPETGGEIK